MKVLSKSRFYWVSILLAGMIVSTANAAPFGDLIAFWDDHEEGSTLTVDHSDWQAILTKYVDDQHLTGINRFDYGAVSEDDQTRLNSYLNDMQSLEPRQLNLDEQKAYWINLYNAMTVKLVIEQISNISSIREIRSGVFKAGPWQLTLFNIVQQDLSLDDVEHGILRPIWRDNRIHYAVNCASLGCPNLLKTAFTAENIEQLLDEASRAYINHQRGITIRRGELILSSIFDWYAEDFGADFDGLLEHLVTYAEPELALRLSAFNSADYDYDWELNR